MGNSAEAHRRAIGAFHGGSAGAGPRGGLRIRMRRSQILRMGLLPILERLEYRGVLSVLVLALTTAILCPWVPPTTTGVQPGAQQGSNLAFSSIARMLLVLGGIETHPGPTTAGQVGDSGGGYC